MSEHQRLDLHENGWFSRFWADKVTPEIEAAWVAYYGYPGSYSPEESLEYWSRCGFFVAGWRAAWRAAGMSEQ